MYSPRTEPTSDQPQDLTQLHAEVAAFNEQMRHAQPANPRKAWVPFGLGAGTALAVFVVVTLLQRFA